MLLLSLFKAIFIFLCQKRGILEFLRQINKKKRLGILDFRILEFLAQGYDFTLVAAMMPVLNYWSSLITFCWIVFAWLRA